MFFSAQNRPRLYWTNININADFVDNSHCVYDILEHTAKFDTTYSKWMLSKWGIKTRLDSFFNAKGKASCLTSSMSKGQKASNTKNDKNEIHKLTPMECERLQTIPDQKIKLISNTQRYKMIGNSFTVNVISYILSNIKDLSD